MGLGIWISASLHDLFLAGEVKLDVVDQAVEYVTQGSRILSGFQAVVQPIDKEEKRLMICVES